MAKVHSGFKHENTDRYFHMKTEVGVRGFFSSFFHGPSAGRGEGGADVPAAHTRPSEHAAAPARPASASAITAIVLALGDAARAEQQRGDQARGARRRVHGRCSRVGLGGTAGLSPAQGAPRPRRREACCADLQAQLDGLKVKK
jgi:hypothetical protein